METKTTHFFYKNFVINSVKSFLKVDQDHTSKWSLLKTISYFVRTIASNSTGCPIKKVSIKNFYSELLKASVYSFWIYLDLVYL